MYRNDIKFSLGKNDVKTLKFKQYKANYASSPQSACFQFFYFKFAVKMSFKPED
jgi:hypothetical protein